MTDEESPSTFVLDPKQEEAVDMVVNGDRGVVTGGPGTGKTTIMRAAVEKLAEEGETVLLLAPTGKAAKRLGQSTGAAASTIHMALATHQAGRLSPFQYGWYIIDEASMLDTLLAARFLSAVPVHGRVFFVGDVDQLPSVGPGQVFKDIIDSDRVPVTRLETVHRAAATSWVCRTAPLIRTGRIDLKDSPDFRFIEAEDSDDIRRHLREYAKPYNDSTDNLQVLVPQNRGHLGVNAINADLQEYLNPGTGGISLRNSDDLDYTIRKHDRVICIANDYKKLVFNGDVGIVLSIVGDDVMVDFGKTTPVTYKSGDAKRSLRLAYAITVHKAQGSEWKDVIVLCHVSHHRMWTRRLLYTAVTRAKETVTLIGMREQVYSALANIQDYERSTTLRRRLEEHASVSDG